MKRIRCSSVFAEYYIIMDERYANDSLSPGEIQKIIAKGIASGNLSTVNVNTTYTPVVNG